MAPPTDGAAPAPPPLRGAPPRRGGGHSLLRLRRIRLANTNCRHSRSGRSTSTSGRGALPRRTPADPDLPRLLGGEGGQRRGRAMLIHRRSSKRGASGTCQPENARSQATICILQMGLKKLLELLQCSFSPHFADADGFEETTGVHLTLYFAAREAKDSACAGHRASGHGYICRH
jgi:hypothetical protein